ICAAEIPVNQFADRGFELMPYLRADEAREYLCEQCGVHYVGVRVGGLAGLFNPVDRHSRRGTMFCSNNCARLWRNASQRECRPINPPPPAEPNAARTARRAEARAGRTCEHCGMAIEAQRTTKRFCSDIFRVRNHRAI